MNDALKMIMNLIITIDLISIAVHLLINRPMTLRQCELEKINIKLNGFGNIQYNSSIF